jgi:hypothetical protein
MTDLAVGRHWSRFRGGTGRTPRSSMQILHRIVSVAWRAMVLGLSLLSLSSYFAYTTLGFDFEVPTARDVDVSYKRLRWDDGSTWIGEAIQPLGRPGHEPDWFDPGGTLLAAPTRPAGPSDGLPLELGLGGDCREEIEIRDLLEENCVHSRARDAKIWRADGRLPDRVESEALFHLLAEAIQRSMGSWPFMTGRLALFFRATARAVGFVFCDVWSVVAEPV